MSEQRPFRPELFLFRMLAAIFVVEVCFLAFAFYKCSTPIPGNPVPLVNVRSPKLGSRSQELFGVAVATVLSLLGGAALSNRRPASDGGAPGGGTPSVPPVSQPRKRSEAEPVDEQGL